MASHLKAYFDGSGKPGDTHCQSLTLAGYAATPERWKEFDELWSAFLARWEIDYLHMKDAFNLHGQFSAERGWTQRRVYECVRDMVAKCLANILRADGECVGLSATVDLLAWRDEKERLGQRLKDPESICVDHAVGPALRLLDDSRVSSTGRSGALEIYFDRGEGYLNKVDRVWRKEKRKKQEGWLRLVTKIEACNMRQTPPLQLADFLAYLHGNSKPDDKYLHWLTMLTRPMRPQYHSDLSRDRLRNAVWPKGRLGFRDKPAS